MDVIPKAFPVWNFCFINSVIGLYFEFNSEGVEYLLTTNVNQDIVESFFLKYKGRGVGRGEFPPNTSRYH